MEKIQPLSDENKQLENALSEISQIPGVTRVCQRCSDDAFKGFLDGTMDEKIRRCHGGINECTYWNNKNIE